MEEFKLNDCPKDCIQNVKFGDSNQFLLACSWDGTVRLYDIFANKLKYKYSHSEAVLDCAFQVSSSAIDDDRFARFFDR